MNKNFTNALRGLAILLVVIQHMGGGRFFINQFTPCGGIGVALFLILSGYGLNESWKKKGLDAFWIGKLLRVYIPYVLWICLQRLLSHKAFTDTDFWLDVSLLKTSYWYVGYLFWWYVIFFVASRWCGRYRLWVMAVAAVCLFFFDTSCIRAEQSLSFVCGVCLSRKKEWIDGISRKACLGIALPSLAVGIVALGIKQLPLLREMEGSCLWDTTQLLIKLPVALAILFGTMTIHERMANNMVLAWLGLMSYELYLVHMSYLGMVNTAVDIISFMTVSLGMAYSFYHLNTYIGREWKKMICR